MKCNDDDIADAGIGTKDTHYRHNNNNNRCVVGAIESMLKSHNAQQEVRNVESVLN